jgi:hypothetical protein
LVGDARAATGQVGQRESAAAGLQAPVAAEVHAPGTPAHFDFGTFKNTEDQVQLLACGAGLPVQRGWTF